MDLTVYLFNFKNSKFFINLFNSILTLIFTFVIDRTRHQFNVGDLSCRAASSVISITDYNVFYCILPLASGVDTVLISLERRKGLCVSYALADSMKSTKKPK